LVTECFQVLPSGLVGLLDRPPDTQLFCAGAYQFSLDAKELAYSQLTAVIKTKTAHGMVPNFWRAG
jgi:hypothetical protein